jgi:hypothetical protein
MDEAFTNDILHQVDDVITLDIDTSTINVPEWLKLPSLPSRERKKLDKQLQEIAQPVYSARGGGDDEMWKITTWNNYDSAFQFAARPCDVSSDDVLSADNLLVLRDHFFRFFVSLLRSYEKHIKRSGAAKSLETELGQEHGPGVEPLTDLFLVLVLSSSSFHVCTQTQRFERQ